MNRRLLVALVLLLGTPVSLFFRPSVMDPDLGAFGPKTVLDLYRVQAAFWDQVTNDGTVFASLEAERQVGGAEKVLYVATGGLSIVRGVPGNIFVWEAEPEARQRIETAKAKASSNNPLVAATADSDPTILTAADVNQQWVAARRQLQDGLRLDTALFGVSIAIAALSAVLTAWVLGSPMLGTAAPHRDGTAAGRSVARSSFWLAVAGTLLAITDAGLVLTQFEESVLPASALEICGLLMAGCALRFRAIRTNEPPMSALDP